MEQIDLVEAERQTFRAATDTGLWDIMIAAVLSMLAIGPYLSRSMGDFWSAAVFLPVFSVLYLVAPPQSAGPGRGTLPERDVIVRCDLRRLKLKGKNVKMVDLFGGPTIKTTVNELRTGIQVKVKDYSAFAWWLERKT